MLMIAIINNDDNLVNFAALLNIISVDYDDN